MCNGQIGCKPGQGHTIARDNEGARRLMSPILKDRVGHFYVWSMTGLTSYWDMQRCYIDAEINRMKTKSVVTVGVRTIKMTGYEVENQGRCSTMSYYVFRQNLNSIFYCLIGLGVLKEDDTTGLFKGKNIPAAQAYLWE